MRNASNAQLKSCCRMAGWRLCLALFLLLGSGGVAAQAPAPPPAPDLMLYPSRVVFEPNERSVKLDLINNLDRTVTYRIRFVNRRMTETGQMHEITVPGPGERFADGMLRYSPRQVMLPPGGAQTVRVLLRKPAELQAGEYRSHLLFERVSEATLPPAGGPDAARGGIAIELQPLVSVTIPVIVRHGETQAQVGLANLALQSARTGRPAELAFELRRQGNRSVFGDLEATFISDAGEQRVIGRAKGVAVYVPNPARRAKLPLTAPPSGALGPGRIELVYRARPESGGAVLARASLRLR